MALLALMTVGVAAQEFELKSGSLQRVLQKDKKAALTIDFSKAKMADLSKKELTETLMMDHLKANDSYTFEHWKEHADECHEFFSERWNDEKGAPKIVDEDSDDATDMTITIKFDYIDFGSTAASLWGWSKKAGGVIMRGTVTFADASGQSVCEVSVNDYRGQSNRGIDMKMPTFGRRMALFHKSLAKDIFNFAKKQK